MSTLATGATIVNFVGDHFMFSFCKKPLVPRFWLVICTTVQKLEHKFTKIHLYWLVASFQFYCKRFYENYQSSLSNKGYTYISILSLYKKLLIMITCNKIYLEGRSISFYDYLFLMVLIMTYQICTVSDKCWVIP